MPPSKAPIHRNELRCFYVPSNAYEAQTNPSVQVLNNGNALITYSSKHVAGSLEIYGQIVDQAGVKIGSEFQINTDTNDHQVAPIISKLTNGNIIVVYESGITDGSRNVKAQILDQNGSKLGSELLLTTTSTDQREVAVAGLNNGNWVSTWQSKNQDGDAEGVYFRIFNKAGDPLGSETLVNTTTNGNQTFPSIAALNNGDFLTSCSSDQVNKNDFDIFGQRFNSEGATVGAEFKMNEFTSELQKHGKLAVKSNGELVATWISAGQDGDGNGIFAQIFDTGTSSLSSSSSSSPPLDSPSNGMAAITAIDTAIKTVNSQRSTLGAVSNRLTHTVNNLTNISPNLSAARGGIKDADFVFETTQLAKNQIMQQASTAMLAQANASKQNVLSLLQG